MHKILLQRTFQYIAIMVIVGIFGVGYWYWQVRAGFNTNTSGATLSSGLSSGLVGYWPFDGDDVSGGTAYDRSGSGYNGSGVTSIAPGKVGQAVSDDSASMGDVLNMVDATDFTISGWFSRDTATSNDAIVSKRTGITAADVGYIVYLDSATDKLVFEVSDGIDEYSVTSSDTFTSPGWNHFVAVFDDNSAAGTEVYINGVATGTDTGTIGNIGSLSSASSTFQIGDSNGAALLFDGKIDEIRIHNRVLSAAEAEALYQAGASDKVNAVEARSDALTGGLVGYWRLDDGSGTSAVDSTGNGLTGTLTNGPTWSTGQIGGAVTFDGVNDYITVADNAALDIGTAYSASAWIKTTSDGYVFYKFVGGAEDKRIYVSGGKATFYLYNVMGGVVLASNTSVNDGSWHLVAGTYDGVTAKIYVDGELDNQKAASGDVADSTGTLVIGSTGSGGYFLGQIDEVRMYSRALTTSEVALLYRDTNPANPDSSLVGYWSFDGQDVSGTTARDRSRNAYNGTLTNSPVAAAGKVNQALSFDGSTSYVNAGLINNFTSQDFTIAHWVRLDSLGNYFIPIYKGDWQSTGYYAQIDATGKVYFYTNQAGATQATTTATGVIAAKEWYHLVYARTGSSVRIYVDGVDRTSVAATHINPASSSSNFQIGRYGTGSFVPDGIVDEVRVYSRTLSAAEVQTLYWTSQEKVGSINTSDLQKDSSLRGLVGYWGLDEGTGTSAADASGNANTGTLTNGPTWGTGHIGGATVFDGVDDTVAINSTFGIGNTNITMAGWVNIGALPNKGTFIKVGTTGGFGIGIGGTNFDNTGSTLFGLYENVRWVNSGYTVTTGWHHFALAINGSGYPAIYWDGNKVYSDTTGAGNAPSSTLTTGIGGYAAGTRPFAGSLDEIRVYNRTLSDDEIYKLYQVSAPQEAESGLVGYWSFNGQDVSGTNAYDRSGKGNTGTLTNTPIPTAGKSGQSLSFNGTNQYVLAGTVSISNSITVSAWVYSSNFTQNGFIVEKTPVNTQWELFFEGSVLRWRGGATENTVYCSVPTNGEWHHVVGSQSGTTGYLYIDGVQCDTGTLTAIGNGAGVVEMGRHSGGAYYFNGKIDEVRVYDRLLSAAEVKALYDGGR